MSGASDVRRRSALPHAPIAAAIIAAHAALLAYSAAVHSPVLDETGHLASGIDLWRTGEARAYCVNPPLVRAVAALPVVLSYPELCRELPARPAEQPRPEIGLRDALVSAAGADIFREMTLARWACLPFAIAGAVVCWRWARELYGVAAGYVALIAWCTLPEVLGHGALITPDVPSAAAGAWAGYTFQRYLAQPTLRRAACAGLLLGLALLTKTTWIILFVLWLLLWLAARWFRPSCDRPRQWGRQVAGMGIVLGGGWLLLNAGFRFSGTFEPLGSYEFRSARLSGIEDVDEQLAGRPGNRFRGTPLARLPVPLPRDYVIGVDIQKGDFERWSPPYFAGGLQPDGVSYFYLYAGLVKLPLGFLLLIALRIVTLRRTDVALSSVLLLSVPATILAVASAMPRLAFFRYLLPAWPFLMVWISGLAAGERWQFQGARLAVVLPLAWLAFSSFAVFPHSLAYFNEMAGGPTNGYAHLIDNHIDWGQDLLYLKKWRDVHAGERPFYVACISPVDPAVAGVPFESPWLPEASSPRGPADIPRGWYAISAHLLCGGAGRGFDAQGNQIYFGVGRYTRFLSRPPQARAGYSILIYQVE